MPASPEAASTRPRRKILSAVALALTLLASLMAFTSVPVDAVPQQRDGECYVEIEVSKYKRQTYETKYTYTKYVSNYFWLNPSSWSLYAGGSWTQTVTTGGEPHQYLSSAGNPITSNGLFHQSGALGSQRNYRYEITSQEQVPTGWEYTDYLTEAPAGDGWILVDTKKVKGDTFPCPEATASPGTCEGPGEIFRSTSEHYTSEIVDGVVTFTPVAPAKFGDDVQKVFDLSETIAQLEGEECDEEVTAVDPDVTQWTVCEVEGELVIPNTGGVKYLLDDEEIAAGSHTGPISGTLTAEALTDHKLTNPEWTFEVDIAAADDCPVDVAPAASLSYECDADVTVTLTSDGEAEFEISVNGEVGATETVDGTENVVVTITETSTIVVTADGEEVLDEVVEHLDCGDVLGEEEEATEEETDNGDNGEVAGDDDEAAEATGATALPMTGASAGLLTLLAGLAMGLGATLRTVSRRFH